MLTALNAMPGHLDEAEQSFVANIRKHGWMRTSVFGRGEVPGYSFTTGMWLSVQHPELVVFSMRTELAHDLFWSLFRHIQSGGKLPIGQRTDEVFANLPCYLFPVAHKNDPGFFGWSRWFYRGTEFPSLQIVWSDRRGSFPWEDGFDPNFADEQLDLTEHGWANELLP